MPTPTKGPRLGSGPAHERLMLANLATALFEHGRITTTVAKAKRLRPLAERLVTFAKRGDLHARRRVLTVVRDKDVVHTLFAEIGPRYESRPGGYTRIVKVGPRKGDNAAMAVIELVEATTGRQAVVREAERARGTRFVRDRPTSQPGEAAGEAAGEQEPNPQDAVAGAAVEQARAAAAEEEAPVEQTDDQTDAEEPLIAPAAGGEPAKSEPGGGEPAGGEPVKGEPGGGEPAKGSG